MILVSLLLLACTGAPPEPGGASDQEAYRRSLELASSEPSAAAEACAGIASTELRDECLLFAARALAESRGEAAPVCGQISSTQSRGACVLEVVDALALSGTEAKDACAHAGQMQERCLSHAIQRELSREGKRFPLGKEREFEAWVAERVAVMELRSTRPDYAGEQCARLIARRRSRQGPSAAFSSAECGTASASTCQEAYRVILRERLRGQSLPDGLCASGPTQAAVAAAGLPAWEDDVGELAAAAWAQTCKEADRRR